MECRAKCVDRCYKLSQNYSQLLDDHQFKDEELKSLGEYSLIGGGYDILWSVNKLARAITKWTRACDEL